MNADELITKQAKWLKDRFGHKDDHCPVEMWRDFALLNFKMLNECGVRMPAEDQDPLLLAGQDLTLTSLAIDRARHYRQGQRDFINSGGARVLPLPEGKE